jgi:hypothetical protein
VSGRSYHADQPVELHCFGSGAMLVLVREDDGSLIDAVTGFTVTVETKPEVIMHCSLGQALDYCHAGDEHEREDETWKP